MEAIGHPVPSAEPASLKRPNSYSDAPAAKHARADERADAGGDGCAPPARSEYERLCAEVASRRVETKFLYAVINGSYENGSSARRDDNAHLHADIERLRAEFADRDEREETLRNENSFLHKVVNGARGELAQLRADRDERDVALRTEIALLRAEAARLKARLARVVQVAISDEVPSGVEGL